MARSGVAHGDNNMGAWKPRAEAGTAMRITVWHSSYGCACCCGHVIEWEADSPPPWALPGRTSGERFTFSHPYGDDFRAWAEGLIAEEFGKEHVADLDWDECLVSED